MPNPNCRICGTGSGICGPCENAARKGAKEIKHQAKKQDKKNDGKKK